ncbi:toprim domain-containing protein [Flavobacterium sp. ARAG 55.4]|uniref:toprim domain-containing protein n=1 Tax=Flavobacterium sp. ARAG 55.4 TaxID=3451357 RepID=UPI003F45DFAF
MNSAQAKEISIEKVLQKQGYFPSKSIGYCNWYLSPFRPEKTPSFKLDLKLNRWFDHGEQKGGNVIDYIVYKFNCSVYEALNYLQDFTSNIGSFSFQKQNLEIPIKEKRETNQIEKIIPIQHPALIQYLKSRNIIYYNNIEQLKEIHYTINDKKYFGLGFHNNSEGWELRSKYSKICLGKKDITLIDNQSVLLRIFEGYFDYLSFLHIKGNQFRKESNYLILNSAALLIKNISVLKCYQTVELYLDNDETGIKYTKFILEKFTYAIDCSCLYNGFKDLNEWLTRHHTQCLGK